METLWQDVKLGLRLLARRPGFTLVAIVALALGIGANTALFSVVNGVLLRPLPYPEPERLVNVWNQILSDGLPQLWLSEPELIYYREKQQSLEGIAVFFPDGANLTGEGEALRVTVGNVSQNLFPLLGIEPVRGRNFTPEEDQPGNDTVLILSHGFWQRQLGGDPNVVGRTLTLNGNPFTVVGVMPAGFDFPSAGVEMWSPIAIDMASPRSRGNHYLQALGRLKPGVTFPEANADIGRVASQFALERIEGATPETIERIGWGAYLIPLHESLVGDVRPALLVLLGAVALVLLIACANLANLLLARASAREKEMAIRAALGASPARIARQLLTESTVLALLGGLAGLVVAHWSLRALVLLNPGDLPRLAQVGIDAPVLGFTLAVSLLTGLLFGSAPAWHAIKRDQHESLKEGGQSSVTSGRHRLRGLLVVNEVALAMVLLIGAGLLLRSFEALLRVDLGYRPESVLTLRLSLPSDRYPEDAQIRSFFGQLIADVRALPGVDSAGAISLLPLSGLSSSGTVSVESPSRKFVAPPGHPHDQNMFPGIEADWRAVTPDYLKAVGMTVVEGRWFTESDTSEAPLVVVVDESFARRFWPEESPLGKRVTQGDGDDATWRSIVGVVRHAKHYGPGIDGREQLYFPHAQVAFRTMYLAVHTQSRPEAILGSVREKLKRLDATLPPFDIRTMEDRLSQSMAQTRFNGLLLATFAVIALVMAAVGIYGVMAYSVTQRTREIGLRMALGARPADIFRMVVGQGMALTLVGILVGIASALLLTRLMASLLFGVSPTDPVTFAALPLVLAGVALAASYLPARRATRVAPMTALRYE